VMQGDKVADKAEALYSVMLPKMRGTTLKVAPYFSLFPFVSLGVFTYTLYKN
jgi:hypothetical protein